MKDLYYLIVREGHPDARRVFAGPFNTVTGAKEYAEEEFDPTDMIFTIISLSPLGVATHEARFVSCVSAWNWVATRRS